MDLMDQVRSSPNQSLHICIPSNQSMLKINSTENIERSNPTDLKTLSIDITKESSLQQFGWSLALQVQATSIKVEDSSTAKGFGPQSSYSSIKHQASSIKVVDYGLKVQFQASSSKTLPTTSRGKKNKKKGNIWNKGFIAETLIP